MGSDPVLSHRYGTFYISIHAPAWGATLNANRMPLRSHEFQSTLPHGERRHKKRLHLPQLLFQSTLPHGERPRSALVFKSSIRISIHAPAWGATFFGDGFILVCNISIHAPAWGATSTDYIITGAESNFNPRSRMGSDQPAPGAWRY